MLVRAFFSWHQRHKLKLKYQSSIYVLVWILYHSVPFHIFILLALIHITFLFKLYNVHNACCWLLRRTGVHKNRVLAFKNIAGLIPHKVIGIFQLLNPSGRTMVDTVSNRSEQRLYILGSKVGQCVGLTTLPHSCADSLEILGA